MRKLRSFSKWNSPLILGFLAGLLLVVITGSALNKNWWLFTLSIILAIGGLWSGTYEQKKLLREAARVGQQNPDRDYSEPGNIAIELNIYKQE